MADFTLDIKLNQDHQVTLAIDYAAPDPTVGYPGYCDVEVITCSNPLSLINDLLGDKLKYKIWTMIDLGLEDETHNITVGHL